MKLKFFGVAVVGLVVSACAFDANEPVQESKSVEATASVAEPVRATDDANMDELRQQAVAANRTQLVLAANANVVAEVASGELGKVYFVENDAGIAMFEAQRVGTPSALADLPANLTALQAFEFLQPNSAVPETLSKAQARVDQLALDHAGQPRVVAPSVGAIAAAEPVSDLPAAITTRGEVASTRQALIDDSLCPGTWFQSALCDYWRTGQGTCSMWKTNTGTYTNNDKNWVYTNSCPYRGTITHRLRQNTWGSWNLVALYTVAAGFYSTIWYSNNTFDFDYESKVYDADGDGWHHSAQWR